MSSWFTSVYMIQIFHFGFRCRFIKTKKTSLCCFSTDAGSPSPANIQTNPSLGSVEGLYDRRRQVKVKAVLPFLLSYLFLSSSDPSPPPPKKNAFHTYSALKLLLEGKEALKGLNPRVDGSPGQDRAGQPAGPGRKKKKVKGRGSEKPLKKCQLRPNTSAPAKYKDSRVTHNQIPVILKRRCIFELCVPPFSPCFFT